MRNARKTDKLLSLEKGTPSPFDEILNKDAIISRSKTALSMRGAETVSEMIPELTLIAREHDLNLNNPADWKEGVRILRMNKLNR